MNEEGIFKKVKQARLLRYLTNCYSMDVVKKADSVYEQGESFLFTYDDHGIDRIAFFVNEIDTLNGLLQKLNKGQYFIEFMTKAPDDFVPYNGVLVAKLVRMVNMDCNSVFDNSAVLHFRNDSVGELARVGDVAEINGILWETFRTEISHLLSNDELEEVINKNQVFVHKTNKIIDAVLQIDVMPKKFYINQIINKTDKSIIHAMLLAQLWSYVQNGGKYLYSWVEDNNIASIKFHQKYGMSPDGIWNVVYCVENKQ